MNHLSRYLFARTARQFTTTGVKAKVKNYRSKKQAILARLRRLAPPPPYRSIFPGERSTFGGTPWKQDAKGVRSPPRSHILRGFTACRRRAAPLTAPSPENGRCSRAGRDHAARRSAMVGQCD